MHVTLDPTLPSNQGVNLQGIEVVGKPYKDQGTWCLLTTEDQADLIFSGKTVAASVRSNGTATPCDVLTFVRQTSNGNCIFTRKLHPVNDAVKEVRQAQDLAAKEALKANGGIKVPTVKAPKWTPGTVVSGQAGAGAQVKHPVTSTATKYTPTEIAELQAAGYSIGDILAMAQGPAASTSPTVKLAAKTTKGSVPAPGTKLAPKS